jgi:membrane fusion protein, multidrug efflux system
MSSPSTPHANPAAPALTPAKTEARSGKIRMYIVAFVVALAAGFGIYQVINHYHSVSTDDAFVDGNIMPISARVAGHIAEVRVTDGQAVKAGDVLVVIDPHDYQIAYERAKAALSDAQAQAAGSQINVPLMHVSTQQILASAQAGVSNSTAGIEAAEQNLNAATASVARAEANAVKSDSDLKRYATLLKHENVSQQQYDQALAEAKSNRAAVEAAQSTRRAAKQALRQAKDRQRQTVAELKTAQTAPQQIAIQLTKEQAASAIVAERGAELHQAELNLSYTIIRAPADGVVGQKHAQVGANVSVGQDLMSVVPLRNVWVTANFKETQLRHMHNGQSVAIRVDAFGGKSYRGHVTYIEGASGEKYSLLPPENATGNYVKVVQRIPVRIDFDPGENLDLSLRPGMSVVPEVKIR